MGMLEVGGLFEIVRIASSLLKHRVTIQKVTADPHPIYCVNLTFDNTALSDSLAPYITTRKTCRGGMLSRRIEDAILQELFQELPPGYELRMISGLSDRLMMATLLTQSRKLAFDLRDYACVSPESVDWKKGYSTGKVPEYALGLSASGARHYEQLFSDKHWLKIFRHPLTDARLSWSLDVKPAFRCSCFFALIRNQKSSQNLTANALPSFQDGAAMIRFWLAVTKYKCVLQPLQQPLALAEMGVEHPVELSSRRHSHEALLIRDRLHSLFNLPNAQTNENLIFMGRLGMPKAPVQYRAVRKELSQLLIP
ncbi:hypothetical protein OLMES_2908 [Oleiphilus messinensis]|uniref:Uncharacterized protein n=1 Tax=Oleiphilus messinensis TaxID=141451 RepID=A0A1Y0IC44_9GAMM|nr:hypothetical protein [Oleiphilus messinensis]ARU56953.1 hypothetical protein OLMES_2908 [Oleiphilus messinensis]